MENMLGRIILKLVALSSEALGTVCDLLERLAGENGGEWLTMLRKFLRKETCWVKENILAFLGAVSVSIPAGQHNIAELFKIGDHKDGVKILGWYGNFGKWCGQVVEEFTEAFEIGLRRHALKQNSLDGPIVVELGGAPVVAIPLIAMRLLMSRQPKGEKGFLLTNGRANVAYWEDENVSPDDEPYAFINAMGKKVVLRAVDVDWGGGGWRVFAGSVAGRGGGDAGDRFFSR